MRSVQAIEWGGRSRSWIVFDPGGAPPGGRRPLVVMLHGGFGDGAQAEREYGWTEAAARRGFVVVYPNGFKRCWNAGTCCGPALQQQVDDVGFIKAVVDWAVSRAAVDPDRVYATGISNGAMLAYRLACEVPRTFAAIAPVAGTMTVPCGGASPTSVLHIHGANDQNVPFLGGVGTKGVAKDSRPSVPETVDRWRAIDRTGPEQVTVSGPVRSEVSRGPDGTTVQLLVVAGAGHQWPGSRNSRPLIRKMLNLDLPSPALDATATITDFFLAHRRPPS